MFGHLGLQAFKEGVHFQQAKRLTKELAISEQAEKKRRLVYLKDVRERTLSIDTVVCLKMGSLTNRMN